MSRQYERARAAFEYLETFAELDDQVELDAQRMALMQNPTKATACDLYKAAIRLWFQEYSGKFEDDRINEIEEDFL